MNPLATLALLAGLAAIICYFFAVVVRDRNRQLHATITELTFQLEEERRETARFHRLVGRHLADSVVLIAEQEALERRNAWLEGERKHYTALIAIATLCLPLHQSSNKFTITKGIAP